MQMLTEILRRWTSRRWIFHLAGLGVGAWIHITSGLSWEAVALIVGLVASEGGSNVLDALVYLKHGPRQRDE